MKKVGKRVCSWLMVMTMGLGVVQIQAPIVAKAEEDDRYECLTIAKRDLTANVILGKNETYNPKVENIGFDDWGVFYEKEAASKYEGYEKNPETFNKGGLEKNIVVTTHDGKKIPYEFNWAGDSENTFYGNDCIRVDEENKEGTLNLSNINSKYKKIYILATAGQAYPRISSKLVFTINYIDGTSDEHECTIYDWFYNTEKAKENDLYTQLIRLDKFRRNTPTFDSDQIGTLAGGPFLQSVSIQTNPEQYVKSINFKYVKVVDEEDPNYVIPENQQTFNVGIFAVTGEKAESSFGVKPSNPNPKAESDDTYGIAGPDEYKEQSEGNDYVYRIHLTSDVDSVKLTPERINAEITKVEKDDKKVSDSDILRDGTYVVKNVTPDKNVTVKYYVKNKIDDTESTYTYIIDRAKGPVIETEVEDSTPDDPTDDPKISDPVGPKEEDVDGDGLNEQVKDITITVPSTQKKVEVKVTPENNTIIDTTYGKDGLNEIVKPDGVKITNDLKDKSSFTVDNLSTDKTVVSVKAVSEDKNSSVIYRYTIIREKSADATIKDVNPKPGTNDDEKIVEITTDKTEYTWPIELNDPKATVEDIEKVLGTGKVTNPEDKSSFKVEGLDPENPVIVKVVTQAENGDTLTYLVKITYEPEEKVNIETTVDPVPDAPENKPVVDDTKEPEKVEDDADELVKKITITVPSVQDTVTVNVTPKEGRIDLRYDEDGLKEIDKPADATITNNLSNKDNPSFTVNKLSADKETVVSIKGVSDHDRTAVIYEYTIIREKSDDATIKDVNPKPGTNDDEKIVEITTDKTEYTWPIELNDPKATVKTIEKVSGTGKVTNPVDKSSFKVEGLDPENPVIVKVVTQAENGDTLTYFVKITNEQLENVNNPVLSETPAEAPEPVQDPAPKGTGVIPAITVQPVDIVYEKTNPQDKTEPIDPAKKVENTGALKVNGTPVDKYTVSQDGKSLIISKDYIDTLPNGTYQAVITYTDGAEQKFSITVVDYNEATIVKNPPLFSMYKEIVLKKKNTFTINLSGITDYAVVKADITGKGKNAKKVVSIKQKANGDVVITPKKVGKSQVTCTIIQNGAEYKVVVDLKVLKQYKGTSKNYNLKNAGLVKTGGELPEFNVYKRIVKGKNTKIKFTKVEKDADVKFYVADKKEAKSLKIGKVKRSGKTVTCTIKGKKKGWVHLTAEITQNGKTYYTRLLVRIDDGKWTSKQLKKYLK